MKRCIPHWQVNNVKTNLPDPFTISVSLYDPTDRHTFLAAIAMGKRCVKRTCHHLTEFIVSNKILAHTLENGLIRCTSLYTGTSPTSICFITMVTQKKNLGYRTWVCWPTCCHCFAEAGFKVVGYDTNANQIKELKEGYDKTFEVENNLDNPNVTYTDKADDIRRLIFISSPCRPPSPM